MNSITYHGYTIRSQNPQYWVAHIYRPGARLIMGTVAATRQEGEKVLLQRAQERIDKDESKYMRDAEAPKKEST